MHYLGICLEGLRKSTKNLNRYNRLPDRDLNLELPNTKEQADPVAVMFGLCADTASLNNPWTRILTNLSDNNISPSTCQCSSTIVIGDKLRAFLSLSARVQFVTFHSFIGCFIVQMNYS
jgi:hypothetical protein